MSNLERVQQIYAAFGKGDVPGILEHMDEHIEWEYGISSTGVPWLQPRRGRDEVPQFFGALGALDLHKFQPKQLFEKDGVVIALVDLEATVKETGRRIIEEDEVHIWHFNTAGKVVKFRHRADTHQHWKAYTG